MFVMQNVGKLKLPGIELVLVPSKEAPDRFPEVSTARERAQRRCTGHTPNVSPASLLPTQPLLHLTAS